MTVLSPLVIDTIGSLVAASSPLVFAGIGEVLTERVGVVNLSLDGSILLAAMAGFAVAFVSGSLLAGVAAAMAVGALVALIVAYGSIALGQNQVAVGFVLTLLCADLSSFLGMPFVRIPGPTVPHWPIPGLVDIPVIGRILFNHNAMVYLSYVAIVAAWWFLAHSRPGLQLRAVGERPEAAYARGIDANRLRYVYTAVGGAFVGLAGAAYSLSVKIGWSHGHTSGMGWIALAIVIFGGWSPLRVALGAYLFGALKSLGSILQPTMPHVPTQVFQAAPFALMIVALVLVSGEATEGAARQRLPALLPVRLRRTITGLLRGTPPAGLGKTFQPD
jgi:ABC-type uncharacterized transport system permease subunit